MLNRKNIQRKKIKKFLNYQNNKKKLVKFYLYTKTAKKKLKFKFG